MWCYKHQECEPEGIERIGKKGLWKKTFGGKKEHKPRKLYKATDNSVANIQTADLEACAMRWVAQLAAFNFDMKFRTGRSNRCADAFSRYPEHFPAAEVECIICDVLFTTSLGTTSC